VYIYVQRLRIQTWHDNMTWPIFLEELSVMTENWSMCLFIFYNSLLHIHTTAGNWYPYFGLCP